MDYAPILSKIVPKTDLKIQIQPVLNKLVGTAREKNIDVEIFLGGSLGKQTYLANDFDADVFLRFSYEKYHNTNISLLLLDVLSAANIAFEVVHGSRDYCQATIEGVDFEFIPVLNISDSSKAKNVTDMSPLHVEWVNTRTDEFLKNDIRLAKYFCKVNRIYGAESYIGGVSGHVIDILIITYGGFENFLKEVAKWSEKTIIDPMNYYDGKDIIEELNDAKTQSPLIVVDPILFDRNAASALTVEKYTLLITTAKQFLAKPSLDFFAVKQITVDSFTTKNGIRVELSVLSKKGKKDVVGAKIKKAFEYIQQKAADLDFIILDADWVWKEHAHFFYLFETDSLPEKKLIFGPPIHLQKECDNFKLFHSHAFEKEGRLVSYEQRTVCTIRTFFENLQTDEYLLQKIESFTVKTK